MITYLIFFNSDGLWLIGVHMIVRVHGVVSFNFDLNFQIFLECLDGLFSENIILE